MNEQQKNAKKKSGGFPWFILIFLIPLMRSLSNAGAPNGFILSVVGVVVCILVISAVVKKAKRGETKSAASSGRPQPKVELHRPAPAMKRPEPVTAQRQFTQPEAYCVSCELSGEDHFVRDRQRRLAQLDEWLKNGLIDREEYRVLKRRFENDQ